MGVHWWAGLRDFTSWASNMKNIISWQCVENQGWKKAHHNDGLWAVYFPFPMEKVNKCHLKEKGLSGKVL